MATQKKTSSERMAMIEIDDVVADFERVAPTLPVALNPDHVVRQEAARRACEEIGIKWPETILPPGTALYSSGVETLKTDRARWSRLPLVTDAIPVVKNALASEERRDFEVPIGSLRLDPKTSKIVRAIHVGQKPGFGYDSNAFQQLLQRIPTLGSGSAPRGHATNLTFIDGDLRAEHVNRHIQRMGEDDATKNVLLRTKLTHNGERVVRAALSERYADVSDIDVANALAGALNGDGKIARLDYRPGDAMSQFEVLYPSEIPVDLFKVGDVHKAVILVSNSETGKGAIKIRAGVVRARCANLTLASGFGVDVSLRHIGSEERVRGMMRAAIGQAAAQIEPLLATIQKSATISVPDGMTPSSVFAKLAKKSALPVSTAKTWNQVFESKYLPQFGANLWSVTSAITESAQQASNWIAQQAEEEAASDLLAKQWVYLSN